MIRSAASIDMGSHIGAALHLSVGQSLGPPNARRFGAALVVSTAKTASVFDEAGLGFKKNS
jgi:hypothetical protein